MNSTSLYIAIAALTVFFIVLTIVFRKKINVFWALLSSLLSAAALFLCVFAGEAGTVAVRTNGDPSQTVLSFLGAFVAGDYDTACSFLDGCSDLGLTADPEDENSALIMDALRRSYSFRIEELPLVDKLTVTQKVQFTHLDLNAVNDALQENTESELQKIVMERDRWDVYDDNNNYLPGITQEAYTNALKSAIKHCDKYLTTETLEITLNYSENAWRIAVNEQLIRAILGGIG